METRDAGGQIISRIVRTYNAAGLLIEEKPILENATPMLLDRVPKQAFVAIAGSSEGDDGQGQPTEMQIDALNKGLKALMSGRVESGTWHTYDAQNRIKTVREINFVFEKTTEIIYNDQGDRAEERRTVSGNSVLPIGAAFSIGDDGTLTPNRQDAEPTESPFDSIEPSVIRYSHQYDDHGNWTEQIANYGLDSEAPSAVRRRKITYYSSGL